MPHFLEYQFNDSPEFVATFDELPLWSAPFGLLLLKHVELKSNMTVLDIGSGAGFPLIELAQRLGNSSKCYGIDPWKNANERAKQKLRNYEVENVEIIEGSAAELSFEDNSVDLIVSNLGINNFDDPPVVFKECARVLKPGCKLVLTTNLDGHWKEFYGVFEQTLRELQMNTALEKLDAHQRHRGSVESITGAYLIAGLRVTRSFEESFEMRFLDGTAMLNHSFVKLGWLAGWREIVDENEHQGIFAALEKNLNEYAKSKGELLLTVPMLYIEGTK
ncbi:class I SAM-dependent methyltransferase [Polluticoccus soli]|uniref:class I SAM-dependent methyltransferase n=1 Tax=Polluticoccus soli TaxID=3034150 RepID=UPI0023E10132|nr:methyltransferase domain-containing protein [Flavipsychrobacter sp. JY13-12]